MFKNLEAWLFDKFAGKIIARGAVTAAGYLASVLAAQHVKVDPVEVSAALIAGAHAAYEWFKAWRQKKSAADEKAVPLPNA